MAAPGSVDASGSTASAESTTSAGLLTTPPSDYFNPADDPLFVGHNENMGVSFVTQKLQNADNYILRRKSMSRALGVKSKLGFVQGLIPRPVDKPAELARWDRCNNVILTWITNSVSDEIASSLVHFTSCIQAWMHLQVRFGGDNAMRVYSIAKDISLLQQGDMTVPMYFGKLLQLWGDEDSYEDDDLCLLGAQCKSTICMHDKKVRTRLQKFLMGLNDIHAQVRTQILSTRPQPTLDAAYSLVVNDESEKRLTKPVVTEASALFSSYNNQQAKSYGIGDHCSVLFVKHKDT
ncbi:hypothetical protein QQ045_000448 [Rhodiola kirilowii]